MVLQPEFPTEQPVLEDIRTHLTGLLPAEATHSQILQSALSCCAAVDNCTGPLSCFSNEMRGVHDIDGFAPFDKTTGKLLVHICHSVLLCSALTLLHIPADTNTNPYVLAKSSAGRTMYLAFSNRLGKPADYLAEPKGTTVSNDDDSAFHAQSSDALCDKPEQVWFSLSQQDSATYMHKMNTIHAEVYTHGNSVGTPWQHVRYVAGAIDPFC